MTSQKSGFSGSPSNALIHLNGVNQILVVGNNLLLWNAATHDTLKECVLTGATRYFTPKKAGYYHLHLAVHYASLTVGKTITVFLLSTVYGGIARSEMQIAAISDHTLSCAIDRYLTPQHQITAYATINNIVGVPFVDGTDIHTYLAIHRTH